MEPSTSGTNKKEPTTEPGKDKKDLNEDLVVFMRKRSETDAPRYTARLKSYVNLQEKKRRAEDARQHRAHQPGPGGHKKSESEHRVRKTYSKNAARFWLPNTQSTKPKPKTHCGIDDGDHAGSENGQPTRRRSGVPADDHNKKRKRMRSMSRETEPSERCGRRRRRRCGRRRRRRRGCSSRGRRRRRRRRCGCRRRRRRTCRRRRRRCGHRRRRRC